MFSRKLHFHCFTWMHNCTSATMRDQMRTATHAYFECVGPHWPHCAFESVSVQSNHSFLGDRRKNETFFVCVMRNGGSKTHWTLSKDVSNDRRTFSLFLDNFCEMCVVFCVKLLLFVYWRRLSANFHSIFILFDANCSINIQIVQYYFNNIINNQLKRINQWIITNLEQRAHTHKHFSS